LSTVIIMALHRHQEFEKEGPHHQEVIEAHNDDLSYSEDAPLTKWATVKRNPRAVMWCIFAVWVIVLTSFESLASSVVLGIPEFRKDFGHLYDNNYVLDAIWQSAISGGPVAT
jgi:MFS transporter, SP family, general alpha glucoside:H+ symporter